MRKHSKPRSVVVTSVEVVKSTRSYLIIVGYRGTKAHFPSFYECKKVLRRAEDVPRYLTVMNNYQTYLPDKAFPK